MYDWLTVLLNAVYSFVALFVVAKLLGKKQIAELDFVDYAVGISIGSISAEWSTDLENPWYFYMIAIVVFFVLSLTITYLERTTPFIKKVLRGKPIIIIADGKIDYHNLKKSKLDVSDVISMCRNKSFFDISQVAYAIFETSGDLSILPKAEYLQPTIADVGVTKPKSGLTKFAIIDGIVDDNFLLSVGKDRTWLFQKLNVQNKRDLKNILVALYDNKNDAFDVHYKK